MTALLPAIFLSSVLGSVHCLAMCGPLVGLHGGLGTLRLALAHSAGRLATYTVLGTSAGLVGHAVDLAIVQRTATVAAGVAILAWGGYQLAIALGLRTASDAAPGSVFASTLVRIRTRRVTARAWLIGVLTGLLPCGWLWAFVIAAAGTGGALDGALVMFVFWAGTVPAMLGVLVAGGPVVAWLRRRMPVISAVALIALGLGTLAMRWDVAGPPGDRTPSCHEVAP